LTDLILPALSEYQKAPPPADYILANLSNPPRYIFEQYVKKIVHSDNAEVQEEFCHWLSHPVAAADHALWSQWVCILKWLYKKRWHPKLKLIEIDKNRKTRDSLECFADLLHSALLVCEQCYLYGDVSSYAHHLYWFRDIALELRIICFDFPANKEQLVQKLRTIAQQIKLVENPFNPIDHPALWELMNVATELATSPSYKGFRGKYLVKKKSNQQKQSVYEIGLGTAFSAVASRIQKDHNLVSMETSADKISLNSGSGRGRKILVQKLFFESITGQRL
jgi:hypothetical protein